MILDGEDCEMKKAPGYLKLNCYDRNKVPVFESHDPSMMWDPVHEMYYSYSTDAAVTSGRGIGIQIRKSKDLVSFAYVGLALSEQAVREGRDNGGYPPTAGFWAPYVEYDGAHREYRMYYSATKAFGSSESRIWLAVAGHPEGPFENRGVVMDTWNTSDALPNAIDAHVVNDREGKKYFVYGSFFGGIFIKELDPATGLAADGNCRTLGKCIAKRPARSLIDGPEGAAVMYEPKADWFYLFLSYGWLGDGYDIRVARSREVQGPYLDFSGKDMVQETLGTKLAGSYCFGAAAPNAFRDPSSGWGWGGFRGPGHGVPFYAPRLGSYFFVHHIRDGAACLCRREGRRHSYSAHYMMVREMKFVDGWPVLSPEPYSGDGGSDSGDAAEGRAVVWREGNGVEEKQPEWGLILADSKLFWETVAFPSLDNGQQHSRKEMLDCRFREDGIWQLESGGKKISARLFKGWDFENGSEGIFFSGLTEEGEAVWGKLPGVCS